MEILVVILLIFGFFLVIKAVVIVSPYEKGLLETLGKYNGTIDSGLNFVNPFFTKIVKVDMRERVLNTPSHGMITKDNAVVTVDAVVFTQVMDPYKSTYEINGAFNAVLQLALTNLRSQIGALTLDECLSERTTMNTFVQTHLSEETAKWGIKVNKVEIQDIQPPMDLINAMQEQKKAEQEKRAQILRAEGSREAQIKESEGLRQGEILKAEGEKQKRILEAEGQALALERMAQARAKALELESMAAIDFFKGNAIQKEQLRVIEESLKSNSKYVLDTDIFKGITNLITGTK